MAATAATAPIFLTAETGAFLVIFFFLPKVEDDDDESTHSWRMRQAHRDGGENPCRRVAGSAEDDAPIGCVPTVRPLSRTRRIPLVAHIVYSLLPVANA